MSAVNSEQRRLLEKVVIEAREVAETAASAALQRLAVDQNNYFDSMSPADRTLRNLLRAESRRLGSFEALVIKVAYQHWHRMLFARFLAENDLLMFEGTNTSLTLEDCEGIANDENNENKYSGQPAYVTKWDIATRYAASMLPGVFRTDDPVLQVCFATEGRQELERLLNSLHAPIFKADDSLGWVYQFWQAKAKKAVNDSGRKVGGSDISPVTQLFTEHYIVQFLLHNSLGAWWAGKHPGEPLPTDLDYLRRLDDGSPASGTFPGWPTAAKDLKILDPTCGSGHFLVAAFSLMVRFRMAEEGLSESDAGDAVLRDNLFGLELDPRCTQIAAFALALTAWKHGGYRELPLPNVVCSGIRFGGTAEDWRKLARGDGRMQAVLEQLRQLFGQAPDLGSLIDPNTVGITASQRSPAKKADPQQKAALLDDGDAGQLSRLVEMGQLLPKLAEAAGRFGEEDDADAPIFGEAIKQAVQAVDLLVDRYHLVITNVPYLAWGKQSDVLQTFCAANYRDAKADLATVFLRRCLQFCESGGATALVTPQNWLFLGSYASLRGYLLRQKTWDLVVRLGPGAFETISGEVVNVGLFVLTNAAPKTGFVPQKNVDPFAAHAEVCRRLEETFDKTRFPRPPKGFGPRTGSLDEEQMRVLESMFDTYAEQNPEERSVVKQILADYRESLAQSDAYRASVFAGLDVSEPRSAREKAELLRTTEMQMVRQAEQMNNPDYRIALVEQSSGELLEKYAWAYIGIRTGDYERFGAEFWELPTITLGWEFQQSTLDTTSEYGGSHNILLWEDGQGRLARYQAELAKLRYASGGWKQGQQAWGKKGVLVSQMSNLPVSLYTGRPFDNNCSVVLPHNPVHLPAIWCFCSSPEFNRAVRRIDQSLKVTNASLVKVPFDLDHWQKVAAEKYPDGLPTPYSDDPTQWIFDGHPAHAKSEQGQPGDALLVAVARLLGYRWPRQTGGEIPGCHLLPDDGLDTYADADGIVCLPPIAGEASAAERLRALLTAAFGDNSNQNATETHATIERLLAELGYGGKTLDDWLRDGFFAQHLKRFQNRPFLWHVWDGVKKDGFSAIVNYHRLDRAKLEKLTYTYLGDWINRQAEDDRNSVPGANARLIAAKQLQQKLEAILEGEKPYDIYVRWKSLAEQPLGWEPDLNDGVRLNIRPFVEAEVLRVKKPNINWNKDRGTNPDGSERYNDKHYTLAEKRAARDSLKDSEG